MCGKAPLSVGPLNSLSGYAASLIKDQRLLIDYRGVAARPFDAGRKSGAFPHIEGQSPMGLPASVHI